MNAQTENPLTKFDAGTLKGIETSDGAFGAPRALFQPQSLGEAMEIAKLMAAGNFVPGHLRGKAGDCLAVVMQAARWGLDPFAVGNKTYFVNDRMAYEAQLVIAVLNTSGVLKGRLDVQWQQTDVDLICTVTGTLKADSQPKSISQEMARIKTKNSPLWVSAPKMQMGYYTSRMWARLFAPEVLLGVYTTDEVEEMGLANAREVVPAAPTRRRVAARKEAEPETAEIVIEGNAIVTQEEVPHDAVTGEVIEVENEEEVARRLDAAQAAQDRGLDDDDQAEPEFAEVDWQPTLNGFERDVDKIETVVDVNSHWSKMSETVFADAPDGVFNRARGLVNARIAELKKGN